MAAWGWAGIVGTMGLLLVGCGEKAVDTTRAPDQGWAGTVGGEGVGATAWSRALMLGDSDAPQAVVAPNGDVLVAATYREPVDLGGGTLPFNRGITAPHLLVARFSQEGTLRWAHGLVPQGTRDVTRVGGLAVDRDGHLWVGGVSAGFDLGRLTVPEGPFVAALSADGAWEHVQAFPGEGRLTVHDVAADGAGGAVVVGEFTGTRDFGDAVRKALGGGRAAFTVRMGPDGKTRWSRAWSARADGSVSARSVAVDLFGNVHVAGGYAGAVTFGGPSFMTVKQSTPFVLQLSPDGEHRWSRDLRGAQGTAQAVAVGPDRVFVAGGFSGHFYFQGKRHDSEARFGFLAAWSSQGSERWARSLAATASALVTDAAGQPTVAGVHDGALDLRPEASPAGLYVARLLPDDGAPVWVRDLGHPGTATARSLATGEDGALVVAGGRTRAFEEDAAPWPRPQDGFLLHLRP